MLRNAAGTYEGMRRYVEAAQLDRRAVAVAPRDLEARISLAYLPLEERADIRPLRKELDAILAEELEVAPKIGGHLLV